MVARIVGARRLRLAGVLAVYLLFGAVYTRPLLELGHSHIAGDPGDPVLNATILAWNATTIPFSAQWWNPPHFHPSRNVSAFTESLVGISPVASPVFWLTNNPLTTYNVALFATWPLSAFGAFLLVRYLTKRADAALLAGLAYGFSPYRAAEITHIQMISSYWMPVALLGLHGYLAERRRRWLVLFGGAWILQSLSNGYLMLFGAVLIGLWLLYFCTTRDSWRTLGPVCLAWALASLPLLPIMLKYQAVLAYNGMRRNLDEPLGLSVPASSWTDVSDVVWLWRHVLPDSADNLFPGVTAASVLLLGIAAALWRIWLDAPAAGRSLRTWLALGAGLSLSVVLVTLFVGPWRVAIGERVLVRVSNLSRALTLFGICSASLIALLPRLREIVRRRHILVFYALATVAMGLFSFGPVLASGTDVLLDSAPYGWLMQLPGFNQVRVPTRFWMLGILCLATSAGLVMAKLPAEPARRRYALFAAVATGLMLDGWIRNIPMSDAPQVVPIIQSSTDSRPIIEIPLGPEWDAAAAFRSLYHRRPVVNGVSGFDPMHYAPLQAGLNEHDPAMLEALATFGSIDVVINDSVDQDGAWTRYVSDIDGAERIASDGTHTVYRLPAFPPGEAVVGPLLPIVRIDAFRHDPGVIIDGRIETEWGDNPQRPAQWVRVDLGTVQQVGGLTHALGEYARDFPRHLIVELSVDGAAWSVAWAGPTAALAFRAAVLAPRETIMRMAFPARPARFVRLRQGAEHVNMWRIAELQVHAPAGP